MNVQLDPKSFLPLTCGFKGCVGSVFQSCVSLQGYVGFMTQGKSYVTETPVYKCCTCGHAHSSVTLESRVIAAFASKRDVKPEDYLTPHD